MLEIRGLTKRYSGIPAVDNVSFIAPSGTVTGYLGPNGSGKSTTVKIIVGLLEPSEGKVLWKGRRVSDDPEDFKRIVGYVPEEPHLYPHLSGVEYLELVGQLRLMRADRIYAKSEKFLRLFDLWEDRHSAISGYSKGMKQKILVAAALLDDPELVILDEPFSGLDVNSSLLLREFIRSIAAAGKTVLFSSHELDTVEKVSSRVVILYKGKVVADDSVERLRDLMHVESLEAIFQQLALQQDPAEGAERLMEAMRS